MARFAVLILAATAAVAAAAGPVGAETFRFTAPDGTVHFTNAPTDPRYQRMGVTTGTSRGWLRLPTPDLSPYTDEIRQAALRHRVPEALVTAVIRVESDFNPRAVSPKGARGLMQLMPGTAALLGVRDSFDPWENIEGGVRHLRGLMERFGNDLPLALAAYNAGEQAVTTYRGIPPFPETRDYVARVLKLINGTSPVPRTEPAPPPTTTYRLTEPDGTIVYTNIPPRGGRL